MMSSIRQISGHTGLYAVIGDPVKHSLSPLIMNSAFAHNGIDAVYAALTVHEPDARLAMQMMRTFGIKGMNVTMPLKQAIVPWLDKLSPEAGLVGAVNCVANREGVLEGYNTDCTGFRLSLNEYFPQAPETAFLLGAGGAARAIASELVRWGCKTLYLTNRSREKAQTLINILTLQGSTAIKILEWQSPEWTSALAGTDILVNATSVGMAGKGNLETLFQWEELDRRMVVYETVYNPLATTFLQRARQQGFCTIAGTELLLWQAVAGFELWTGTRAPVEIMKSSLIAALESN